MSQPTPHHTRRHRSDLDGAAVPVQPHPTCTSPTRTPPPPPSNAQPTSFDQTFHQLRKSTPSPGKQPASWAATHTYTKPARTAAPATPNSQVSEPSTDGSRSIPFADVHTLAHLLSADRATPPPASRADPPAHPRKPAIFEPLRLRPDEHAAQRFDTTATNNNDSVISDVSCPDVLFRPISPVERSRRAHAATKSAPTFRPLASSVRTSSPTSLTFTPVRRPDEWPADAHARSTPDTPALLRVPPKRAHTTVSATSSVTLTPLSSSSCSSHRRADGMLGARAPQGISWHRAQAEAERVVHRVDSTASECASTVVGFDERRQRSDGFIGHVSEQERLNHVAGESLQLCKSDTLGGAGSYGVATKRARRRKSSYLTMAFLKRKASHFGDRDRLQHVRLQDEDVMPVHAYTRLTDFGNNEAADCVVLYTNSVRAEVNDLIFLTTILQRCCGVESATRKKHRNIDVDFELWFSRFAQYTGLLLFGIEEYVMRFITEVLAQRDVMLSRCTADVEAEGVSRVQAWSQASKRLFERMDNVRGLLNDVDNRVMWLRRSRQYREDLGRPDAWVDTFASVRRLVPGLLQLLDDIDDNVSAVLALKMDFRRGLRRLYRQFATLLTKEGAPPLGWSAVITLTRWIGDRKLRNEHVRAMSRAARLSLFSRYRSDNSHHTIVRVHQNMASEDRKACFGLM